MIESEREGIAAWFVRNPVAANLLMILIVVWGAVTAVSLPRESFPSFAPSVVTVDVEFPSGSPQLTEESIVLRVETALQGVQGVKRISSVATSNSASITVEKDAGYDLDQLLTDVKARVDAIPNLPGRAERPSISKQAIEEHVIWVQLHGGDVERHTLEPLARDLQKELQRDPNIRRVDLSGHRRPEVQIEVDEEALQEYGLSLEDVSNVVQAESFADLSGELRSAAGTTSLKADRQAYWRDDFVNIPLLTTQDGVLVRLGDIATVTEAYAESPHSWMRFQEQPSIGLQVYKDPQRNTAAASETVEEVLSNWRKSGRVPERVQLTTWNDRSQVVSSRIALLLKNALLGMLLVFGILAFTIDRRVAFWVAMGLPVAFGGAFIVMGALGFALSINDLTTFGMIVALGIIVDDAVVVGESVYTEKRKGGGKRAGTIRGVHRVAVPTVFGVLTTVAAFSVLPFVEGDMGQIFAQFAIVVAAALVFSIIESKIILPAHLAPVDVDAAPKTLFGRGWAVVQRSVDRLFEVVTRGYQGMLRIALRWRYATLCVILAVSVCVVGFVARGAVRLVFFPDIPGQVVGATLTMEEGAGFGLTEQNLARLEEAFKEAAEAASESPGATGITALQVLQSSDGAGRVQAELPESSIDPERLVDEWTKRVGTLEGASFVTFATNIEGGAPPIRLEMASADEARLLAAHDELKAALEKVPGVKGLKSDASRGRSEIQLKLTELGRASGMSVAQLSNQIQQSFFGYEVQRVQRGPDEVRVRVRYPEASRRDESDLGKAWVRTNDGTFLPLSSVAELSRERTPSSITRIDGRRVVSLTFTAQKRTTSATELLALLDQTVLPQLAADFPTVNVTAAGEAEEIDETMGSFVKLLFLALGLIYALLAIPLKSYWQPLIIMAAIPFGVLGAVVGHWAHAVPVSLLSMFGMLALAGVVVNDSLLLVATFNRIRGEHEHIHGALIAAGGSRVRAIVLTSVTTYAGLVPLVFGTSEQAQYLIPAAISLAYGVLFATILTLVLIPLLHAIGADF